MLIYNSSYFTVVITILLMVAVVATLCTRLAGYEVLGFRGFVKSVWVEPVICYQFRHSRRERQTKESVENVHYRTRRQYVGVLTVNYANKCYKYQS